MTFDPAALRDSFHVSNLVASQHALWPPGDPEADPDKCRYCGDYWRRWAGSKLDGHAACIVTDDFKRRILELLRPSTVTYRAVAEALGVSISVVRSWTFPIRSGK